MMTSTMDSEPRVRREALALSEAGCDVVALGTMAVGDEARREFVDDLEIRRFDLLDGRLVRALKSRRADPGHPPSESDGESAQAPPVDRIGDAREIVHHLASFVGFLWYGWRADADVYHPHDLPPLLAALVLGAVRRKPVVYESHEYWAAKYPDRPMARRWVRFLERNGCRRADLVVVVNDTIADRMAADYAIERPLPILNVPRMPALGLLPIHDPDAPLQILYHGILVPGRGIERLIDAVGEVSHPVHLVIRGDGPLRPELEERCRKAGIEDRCRFDSAVPLDDLVEAAAESDVGVMPFESRLGYDVALPNKLFEYLAAGLAILSSDLPELRRVIQAHDVGVLVQPGDVSELAVAIDGFATDRVGLEACRRRALEAASTTYTWTLHRKALVDAYRPLLSRRDRS